MSTAHIKSLLSEGGGASATSLSNLISFLKDPTTAAHLVCSDLATSQAVVNHLVAVANDSSKNPAVRFMAVEGLYHISQAPYDQFRRGTLFTAVQGLNDSFSTLFDREAERLDSQREMLTVLLLRCSGYTKLKAGDLLQQLCEGDEARLVKVLISVLQNSSYESQIIDACCRMLYELSTPSSYFHSSEGPIQTTTISVFHAKMAKMLQMLEDEGAFETLFSVLEKQWQASCQNTVTGLSHLGTLTSYGQSDFSAARMEELSNWGVRLRNIAGFVLTVSEYCADQSNLVKTFQRSCMIKYQSFIASVLIPYTVASLFTFCRTYSSTSMETIPPSMSSAIAVLKLMRFAMYKAEAALSPALVYALSCFCRVVQSSVRVLAATKLGILSLVLAVELLCNVDAYKILTPHNLSADFAALLDLLKSEEMPVSASGCTFSQCFIITFLEEDSSYCEYANSSTDAVHEKFAEEEAQANAGVEAFALLLAEGIRQLEMNLGMLDMFVAAGLLALERSETENAAQNNMASQMRENITQAPSEKKEKKKKKKHPEEFCCQLTGKLMREPVVLSNGHRFELDELQSVIDRMGHIDPISGESLDENIDVNSSLQQRIAEYKIQEALKKK